MTKIYRYRSIDLAKWRICSAVTFCNFLPHHLTTCCYKVIHTIHPSTQHRIITVFTHRFQTSIKTYKLLFLISGRSLVSTTYFQLNTQALFTSSYYFESPVIWCEVVLEFSQWFKTNLHLQKVLIDLVKASISISQILLLNIPFQTTVYFSHK